MAWHSKVPGKGQELQNESVGQQMICFFSPEVKVNRLRRIQNLSHLVLMVQDLRKTRGEELGQRSPGGRSGGAEIEKSHLHR